jgi:glycosyltransferase involved in cell wall biosynthesis
VGPLVSVVVPVWNGEAYLGEALDSVLAQDYGPLEVVVVDDGSTDGSAAVAARYGDPVRCVRQANQGPAAARNRGLAESRGALLAFLDADDRWLPGKLTRQVAWLAGEPGVDVVTGPVELAWPEARVQAAWDAMVARHAPDGLVGPCLGSALIRRAVFDRVGAFDAGLRFGEDWDWVLRVKEHGVRVAVLAEPVLWIRRHDRNMTCDEAAVRRGLTRALKRSLDRRRAAGAAVRPLPWFRPAAGPPGLPG